MASLPLDTVVQGDCLAVMRTLPDACVDAVVTDPPAGIAFMGKDWDAFRRRHNPADVGRDSVHGRMSAHAPHSYGESDRGYFIETMTLIFAECLRLLKPGGHALVWALPRTSHWTGMALEDAGFEIRDRISHIFGQGFPKSLNLHGEHEGWGTALKPAVEDWWLCRKPLAEPNVAANVLRYGTGALNVDACRVGYQNEADKALALAGDAFKRKDMSDKKAWARPWMDDTQRVAAVNAASKERAQAGRWPANLVLDEAAAALLDAQSGVSRSSGGNIGKKGIQNTYAGGWSPAYAHQGDPGYGDTGGASRFFPTFRYVAKASRAERNRGCEGLSVKAVHRYGAGLVQGQHPEAPVIERNTHPTVKPITLMTWLITLITPPGGVVLDPFAGSGTTCVAAKRLGMRYIGIEREAEYVAIANARIAHAQREPMQAPTARKPSSTKKRVAVKRQKSAPVARPSLWEGVGA